LGYGDPIAAASIVPPPRAASPSWSCHYCSSPVSLTPWDRRVAAMDAGYGSSGEPDALTASQRPALVRYRAPAGRFSRRSSLDDRRRSPIPPKCLVNTGKHDVLTVSTVRP
jgi:hypothetical protein